MPEAGGAEAGLTFEAASGVGLVEEDADLADDGSLAAEVDGALSAAVAPGESVVGSEAALAGGAPGGDDGALAGEAVGVVGEEADGCMVGCTCGHAYMLANWRDFSIGKLNLWGGFLGGQHALRVGRRSDLDVSSAQGAAATRDRRRNLARGFFWQGNFSGRGIADGAAEGYRRVGLSACEAVLF